jgi:hypothetical protein
LLLPLALLAGCNKSSKSDERSATGEVLRGTISDDMLPLDKLKSEPPLLAPNEQAKTPEGAEHTASGEPDAASETSTAPDEAAPVPAPSPSTTSSPARGGGSPQG